MGGLEPKELKVLVLLFCFLFSLNLFASDLPADLIIPSPPRADSYIKPPNRVFHTSKSFEVNGARCLQLQEHRSDIPDFGTPAHTRWVKELQRLNRYCYFQARVNRERNNLIVEFDINNSGSPKSNPDGMADKLERPIERLFNFRFPQRARQNLKLSITDNSGVSGRLSHDLLETTIVFLPRKVIPAITPNLSDESFDLTLPTGEVVTFSMEYNEIIGGIISEDEIDRHPSRHQRKFAGINYSGSGLMIRADRRGGLPEHEYDIPFNQNELPKHALITYGDKTCKVRKNKIWKQEDGDVSFLYPTDGEFIEKVLIPLCGFPSDFSF